MYAVIALYLVRNQILDHLSFFSLCLGHCPYSDGCILCYFSSFKPPFHLTSSVKTSLISDILIASTHGHILIFLPDYALFIILIKHLTHPSSRAENTFYLCVPESSSFPNIIWDMWSLGCVHTHTHTLTHLLETGSHYVFTAYLKLTI